MYTVYWDTNFEMSEDDEDTSTFMNPPAPPGFRGNDIDSSKVLEKKKQELEKEMGRGTITINTDRTIVPSLSVKSAKEVPSTSSIPISAKKLQVIEESPCHSSSTSDQEEKLSSSEETSSNSSSAPVPVERVQPANILESKSSIRVDEKYGHMKFFAHIVESAFKTLLGKSYSSSHTPVNMDSLSTASDAIKSILVDLTKTKHISTKRVLVENTGDDSTINTTNKRAHLHHPVHTGIKQALGKEMESGTITINPNRTIVPSFSLKSAKEDPSNEGSTSPIPISAKKLPVIEESPRHSSSTSDQEEKLSSSEETSSHSSSAPIPVERVQPANISKSKSSIRLDKKSGHMEKFAYIIESASETLHGKSYSSSHTSVKMDSLSTASDANKSILVDLTKTKHISTKRVLVENTGDDPTNKRAHLHLPVHTGIKQALEKEKGRGTITIKPERTIVPSFSLKSAKEDPSNEGSISSIPISEKKLPVIEESPCHSSSTLDQDKLSSSEETSSQSSSGPVPVERVQPANILELKSSIRVDKKSSHMKNFAHIVESASKTLLDKSYSFSHTPVKMDSLSTANDAIKSILVDLSKTKHISSKRVLVENTGDDSTINTINKRAHLHLPVHTGVKQALGKEMGRGTITINPDGTIDSSFSLTSAKEDPSNEESTSSIPISAKKLPVIEESPCHSNSTSDQEEKLSSSEETSSHSTSAPVPVERVQAANISKSKSSIRLDKKSGHMEKFAYIVESASETSHGKSYSSTHTSMKYATNFNKNAETKMKSNSRNQQANSSQAWSIKEIRSNFENARQERKSVMVEFSSVAIKGDVLPDRSKGDFYCRVCDSHISSELIWESHIVGKRHRKNLKKSPWEKPSKVKSVKRNIRPILLDDLQDVEDAIVGLDHISEIIKADRDVGPNYACYLCSGSFTRMNIITHLISTKHRLNYMHEVTPQLYQLANDVQFSKAALDNFVENKALELEYELGRGNIEVRVEIVNV